MLPVLAALGGLVLYLVLASGSPSSPQGANAAKAQYGDEDGTGTTTVEVGVGAGAGASGGVGGPGSDPCEGLPPSCLFAVLTGDQVVPGPGDDDGFGVAVFVRGSLCFDLEWTNILSPDFGAIFSGKAGKDGDLKIPMFSVGKDDPELEDTADGCREKLRGKRVQKNKRGKKIKNHLLDKIEAHPERFYAELENEDFEDGAIRGQLHQGCPSGADLLRAQDQGLDGLCEIRVDGQLFQAGS